MIKKISWFTWMAIYVLFLAISWQYYSLFPNQVFKEINIIASIYGALILIFIALKMVGLFIRIEFEENTPIKYYIYTFSNFLGGVLLIFFVSWPLFEMTIIHGSWKLFVFVLCAFLAHITMQGFRDRFIDPVEHMLWKEKEKLDDLMDD